MKRTAFVASAALSICFAGCRVSAPGKWETSAITRIKHSVTVGGKTAQNPLSSSPETVANGKDAFSHYCVACHGLDGQNTGVPFADRMSPPVPSLNSATVQSYTDGQLKWIVENGISPSGMPASKGILTDKEIWAIVVYLRHLPEAGSLGEPRMYSGDDSPKSGVTRVNHKR
jgi:mono/diheme cytochrome c family protein